MSFEQPDILTFEGNEYKTVSFPLAPFLESRPVPFFVPVWPHLYRGYVADWAVESGHLCLTDLKGKTDAGWLEGNVVKSELFTDCGVHERILAKWFTGTIHAMTGKRRYLGVPAMPIYDYDLVLTVASGKIVYSSLIANTSLPDPTDDELQQILPAFLWPDRLQKSKL